MSTDLETSDVISLAAAAAGTVPVGPPSESPHFLPLAPQDLAQSGLSDFTVEALVLKAVHAHGAASSRTLATQIKLPGDIVRQVLDRLRAELLVVHRGTTDLVDFVFQLTESGVQRVREYSSKSTYCGAAPVTLDHYAESVVAQSVARRTVLLEDFRRAMSGLFLKPETQSQLAQAINAGLGLFLYGPPGNGKTSVALQLMKCYPDYVWIPRAIIVGGDIIRLFDSSVHREVDLAEAGMNCERNEIDRRWVLVERPTVVVGGELTMNHLELHVQFGTGVLEAPIQMKSNCGTLVIDDFGRQRVSPTDILNRWIVPLEHGLDYLTMPNGRQIQMPFEQNLVLATNLEPTELVDEAFLRRIPYKVELTDPTEQSFRSVFFKTAEAMDLQIEDGSFEYLVKEHYVATGNPFRYCHPRDLLFQINNLCKLHGLPRMVTPRTLDAVVRNYFGEQKRFKSAPGLRHPTFQTPTSQTQP